MKVSVVRVGSPTIDSSAADLTAADVLISRVATAAFQLGLVTDLGDLRHPRGARPDLPESARITRRLLDDSYPDGARGGAGTHPSGSNVRSEQWPRP
jgi:hypothetical protein